MDDDGATNLNQTTTELATETQRRRDTDNYRRTSCLPASVSAAPAVAGPSSQSCALRFSLPNKNVLTNSATRCICHTLRQILYCDYCGADDWPPEAYTGDCHSPGSGG